MNAKVSKIINYYDYRRQIVVLFRTEGDARTYSLRLQEGQEVEIDTEHLKVIGVGPIQSPDQIVGDDF